MTQPARLITPNGKTIELSTEAYREVRQLLASRKRRRSRAQITQSIESSYGKYAGGPSLTRQLLTERGAERARDVAKLSRLHE